MDRIFSMLIIDGVQLAELLRKSAEHTLMDMVQLLFSRLPGFMEDAKWMIGMKKVRWQICALVRLGTLFFLCLLFVGNHEKLKVQESFLRRNLDLLSPKIPTWLFNNT